MSCEVEGGFDPGVCCCIYKYDVVREWFYL